MSKTAPTRPGPVAYIGLGVLIAVGLSPLAIRVITFMLGVSVGRAGNLALFVGGCALLTGAGAYGAYLIVRYFRACRAEDHAEREAREAQLRAEAEALRAQVTDLHDRVQEVEDKAWWGDPETQPSAEDTIDLSNVRFLPQPKEPPESRSS